MIKKEITKIDLNNETATNKNYSKNELYTFRDYTL